MYNKIKVKSAKGGIGMGGIFSDIYNEKCFPDALKELIELER